jgi:LuxR family maltose regulon positive regulatory protein
VRLTQARLLMARGEWAATLALLSVRDDPGEPADPRGAGLEEVLLAALAFQAGGDLGAARATLERGLALAEPEGYVRLFVDEGVEAATLLGRWLAAPLRADQRERFATLREYAERLLTAFPSRVPELAGPRMSLPGLAEPLTARERDVLGLMAAGLTNAEIAERLFISVSTVKTYVNTLFAKFAVRHRAQAVARARELGLLME